MRNGRYSDAQIMAILKQVEGGMPVSEPCREHGMSSASFYKWRAEFGGMDVSLIAELKDIAEQNRRLKRMYAEMGMQNDLLKGALGKSVKAVSEARTSRDIAAQGPADQRLTMNKRTWGVGLCFL